MRCENGNEETTRCRRNEFSTANHSGQWDRKDDTSFYGSKAEQKREAKELIHTEELNQDAARRYILTSLKKGYASENGTELNEVLPKMSPLNPRYLTKKQTVYHKMAAFVDKFKGVGGTI